VAEALAALASPLGGRATDVWIGASRGPESLTRLTVSWDPSEGVDARRPTRLTVEPLNGETQDPIGEMLSIVSASVVADSAATVTFDKRPGTSFVLRFAALGPNDEVIDRWTQPVTVPALDGDGLALSTLRVFRAQSAFEARAIAAATDPAPSATRRFRQTDRVFVDVDCYASGGATPMVSVHLLNGVGDTLVELPVTSPSDGRTRINLPVSSLAPGTYVLRFSARAGERVIQQRLAFLVTR